MGKEEDLIKEFEARNGKRLNVLELSFYAKLLAKGESIPFASYMAHFMATCQRRNEFRVFKALRS